MGLPSFTVVLLPVVVSLVAGAGVGGVGRPAELVHTVGVAPAVRPDLSNVSVCRRREMSYYPIHGFQLEWVHSLMSLQPTLAWKFSYPPLQGQEKEP